MSFAERTVECAEEIGLAALLRQFRAWACVHKYKIEAVRINFGTDRRSEVLLHGGKYYDISIETEQDDLAKALSVLPGRYVVLSEDCRTPMGWRALCSPRLNKATAKAFLSAAAAGFDWCVGSETLPSPPQREETWDYVI